MPAPSPKILHLRLATAQFAVFVVLGLYLPFWSLWLKGRGFDEAQIGYLIAGPSLVRIFLFPFIAWLADHTGQHRRITIVVMTISTLALFASTTVTSFAPLLALLIVFYGGFSAIFMILDHLVLSAGARAGVVYGRVRLFGSFGYLLANELGGYFLRGKSSELIHQSVLTGMIVSTFVLLLMPAGDSYDAEPVAATRVTKKPALPLLALICLVVGYGLIQASHGAFYVCSSLYWKKLGYAEDTVGNLWAIGVVAEIAFFAIGARLMAFGVYRWLVIGGVVAMLRWTLFSHCTTTLEFVALQITHALTFGATQLAGLSLLREIVPRGRGTTAQGILYAISGLIGALSMMWSGRLYEAQGATAFTHMVGFALAGTIVAIVSKPWIDRARASKNAISDAEPNPTAVGPESST